MSKYIIIDAEAIQKRIEELEVYVTYLVSQNDFDPTSSLISLGKEIIILKEILSQSTPLIPEIEKAMDNLRSYVAFNDLYETKQDYISNLKLDI